MMIRFLDAKRARKPILSHRPAPSSPQRESIAKWFTGEESAVNKKHRIVGPQRPSQNMLESVTNIFSRLKVFRT